MAITETVTCDVCGKVKADVNHWWMYDPPNSTELANNVGFVVWPWDATTAKSFKHACGQECVIQAVNRWMGENSK